MTDPITVVSRLSGLILLTDKALAGADRVDASADGRRIEVTNPATGAVLTSVPAAK